MEVFIESVRKHPCLWNPVHPDYREMHVKDEAWQEVVESYDRKAIPNIQIAKLEWKKLRDNHRDALKRAKLGKNKLLPAQITTWKYAKAMQFLEPHMKYRITENIEMDPLSSNTKQSDSDVSTSGLTVIKETPPNKRRRLDAITAPATTSECDALESFFKCTLKSTREMPYWMQTQVKKKIFAVIIDAEEQLSSQEQMGRALDLVQIAEMDYKVKTEIVAEDTSDIS